MKRLVVNADDFGFTRDVNAGIVEAHRNGILRATTLMAEAPAFDDAVRLAHETPTLDVGCHFVLVQLPGYPDTVAQLIRAVATRSIDIRGCLMRQAEKIVRAGIRPVHADTHKHTHLLPPVLDALAGVCREFGIRWVRRPFDFPGHPGPSKAVGKLLPIMSRRFRRVLDANGLRSTDHFAGFRITGAYGAEELRRVVERLPKGTTEFMSHPGFCTDELRAARTRLKESRERELRALCDPGVVAAVQSAGVELSGYRSLR